LSLREVLDVLSRRWYLSLAVLLLTLGAGWLVVNPGQAYTASEIFAVQPPASPQVPNQLNVFRPSLAITAAVVAQRLKSPSGIEKLRARGVVGDYDVVPRNSGTVQTPAYIIPSLQATVTTFDATRALRSLAIVMQAFEDELTGMQDERDVAPSQRITINVLAPPSAIAQLPTKARAVFAVGVIGLAGSILLPQWVEAILVRRQLRRAQAAVRSRTTAAAGSG
jgi:hypothetical protein